MKVRTDELSGAALDWMVAQCEGYTLTTDGINKLVEKDNKLDILGPCTTGQGIPCGYSPSSYWSIGGPIIEREHINIEHRGDSGGWRARIWAEAAMDFIEVGFSGPYCKTALIAAMRCYVASKLGVEVDVPAGLPGARLNA
jgi:hypothetical protein